MKFAKLGGLVTACWVLSGCEPPNSQGIAIKQTFYYREICVDGVVYLRSGNGYLTPKVNKDFYPYVCAIKKERNNG